MIARIFVYGLMFTFPVSALIAQSTQKLLGNSRNAQQSGASAEVRARIAEEMEKSLVNELLAPWYPRAIDSLYGGFLSSFTYDFKPVGSQDKMIVTQARHTWVNARASTRYPNIAHYKSSARFGFLFLKNAMWDKTYGGFYTLVDRKGKPKAGGFAAKEAYGNAFGIYALAAYYKASGDTAGLNLAKQAFLWLERHSHDPIHKGYFQHMQRNGDIIKRPASEPTTSDLGYKDQNSSIHLLEAFTELYEVWPDPLVRERLDEMLILLQQTIIAPSGSLTLFFQPDWTPVSFRDSDRSSVIKHKNLDHLSFGHDVETAYLMIEASHVLGRKNDTATAQLGKRMVDHALLNGWDSISGGFYDEAYNFRDEDTVAILRNSKNWWAQSEALNTLLLMADLFPDDPMDYFKKFELLWRYAQSNLIDHEHGDWYEYGLDTSPSVKKAMKGHIWKGTYHTYRSLSNCVNELRKPKS